MKKIYFKNFFKSSSKGFTLVELLIYSVIFVVVAGLLTSILIIISRTQTREVSSFELQRQLQFSTQRIQHAIRDASLVESVYEGDVPGTPCTTFCSIRLRTRVLATDPTIISSDASGIYIQEGLSPRISLTTADTNITSLRFTRVTNPGGFPTISIDLAMVANPNDPQFRVERNLISAVTHVSAATFSSNLLPDATGSRNIGETTLRWNNLILSGGVNIVGPESAGEQAGISMARGLNHGTSSISQYFITATPHNRFGQRLDIGGTPVLHLEGDMGQATRRAYFMNANVGIGTTGPTRILGLGGEVARNIGIERRTATGVGSALTVNAGGAFSGGTNLTGGDLLLASGISTGNVGSNIHFQTATPGTSGSADNTPSTKMTILGSGNVGIGTTAPVRLLHIRGDHNTSQIRLEANNGVNDPANLSFWASEPGVTFEGTGIGNNVTWQLAGTWGPRLINAVREGSYIRFVNSTTIFGTVNTANTEAERMRITSTGNIGIGTTSPTHPLQMASGAHVTAVGAWTNASDIALKREVVDINYGLADIMNLQPKAYRMKSDGSKQIGFIAQELKKVIPEIVSGKEGEKGISYGNLTAVLVKAIQEQQSQIEELKSRIQKLEPQSIDVKHQ